MTKNICATLDLNKSIRTFQLNVTKLLDFANIPELDGKNLKEREEEIRVQALILAGQWALLHETKKRHTSLKRVSN
ncbi:hypothetical protein WKK05_36140 (plasmid) [Nostoc sp. UHCC 0302]|uniref:hypothetical protein n=1 Tax=Nostoc sp. UHCC 0302 TaxID=3134896 RepID=UPI00311CB2FE